MQRKTLKNYWIRKRMRRRNCISRNLYTVPMPKSSRLRTVGNQDIELRTPNAERLNEELIMEDYYFEQEKEGFKLVECWWFLAKLTYHAAAIYSIYKLIT